MTRLKGISIVQVVAHAGRCVHFNLSFSDVLSLPSSASTLSPHDVVVFVDGGAVSRPPQVARVTHHCTAEAPGGVPGAVGGVARDHLEEALQHLLDTVGLELGLKHLEREQQRDKAIRGTEGD